MEKVLSAMMDMSGLVTLKLENKEGTQREICFSKIRCGISWPIENNPAYFCVLGLLNGAKPGDLGSLLFLKEGEEDVADNVIEKVINSSRDLRFSEIFTDRRKPEWMGFCANLEKHLRSNRYLQDLRLRHVAFAENFTLGRDLIKKWGKSGALKIPDDSIIHAQLVGKEPQIFSSTQESTFYAINALRYVTLAFEKIPVRKEGFSSNSPSSSVLGWS